MESEYLSSGEKYGELVPILLGVVLALIGIFIVSKARSDQRLLKFFGVILFPVGTYFLLVSLGMISEF
jgi:uncharacterized membrane protein YeaQ/YmgE (transglycosylase-associated protein family)